jgi:hypothetical protein
MFQFIQKVAMDRSTKGRHFPTFSYCWSRVRTLRLPGWSPHPPETIRRTLQALAGTIPARLAISLLMLALIGAGIILALHPEKRVSRENFARIRVGMSRAEIRRLLGGPASSQATQLGLVRGPDAYSTSLARRCDSGPCDCMQCARQRRT